MLERINLKLTVKLVISFLLLAIATIAVFESISFTFLNKTMSRENSEFLSTTSNYKKTMLETYLNEKEKNLKDLASGNNMSIMYSSVVASHTTDDNTIDINAEGYAKAYNQSVAVFSNFISTYGFDDVYFISKERAQIVFNVKNKRDLGEILDQNKHKTTALARLWKKVMMTGRFNIIDFEPFAQSGNTYTLFLGVPVYHEDRLVGALIGLVPDKNIDEIINLQYSSRVSLESFIIGFSDNDQVIYKSNPRNTNAQIGKRQNDIAIETALKKGEIGTSYFTDESNESFMTCYVPFNFNGLEWMIFSSYPTKDANEPVLIHIVYSAIAILCILIFVATIGYLFASRITRPFIHIRDCIIDLSKGRIPEHIPDISSKSEIGQIQHAINDLVSSMNEYISFADKIGNNQLDAEFKNTDQKDILGQSLISMPKNLVEAARSAEERKTEEAKQKWMTEGIAHFGDILRQQYKDMSDHGFNIISNLVNFLNVCQGGIFIKSSDNENTLELLASFAYGRKKHLKKTFDPGEGLIGACFVEHETIYLTNIPDDYPEISSGLGGTQPKFVLMVPLKIDKLVLGVVELISLNEIKSHEIQFVEKISENIASSINTSQVANKTKRLLDEAKFRSEQLVTQEEEMGQNMEELHATQEESQRKEFETSAVLDILFNSTIIVELSLDGKIIFANKGFCNLLNTSLEKIQGLFYNALNQDASIQLLGEVIKGNKKDITSRIIFNGLEYYVKEHYAVTLNQYFEPAKVYVIIQDITEEVFAKKHMSK